MKTDFFVQSSKNLKKMYFEKIYKVNNNGKIAGYHKRGKREEDGTIKYFINDHYGDENELKKIKNHDWQPFRALETYLNPFYFNIPNSHSTKEIPLHELDDSSFIKHCETKTKEEIEKAEHEQRVKQYLQHHKDIKEAIRKELHKQLDEKNMVDNTTLEDFKFAVENENKTLESGATDKDVSIWEVLGRKYLPQ